MFTQKPYRCRLDWGRYGTRKAAERGDILVIVDTISFATAAITAIQRGGIIYPCSFEDDPVTMALRLGGEAAMRNRKDVPEKGRFSLSPLTYEDIEPGTKVVLASPNGATCTKYAGKVPYLFVAALCNAEATANVISSLLSSQQADVTVIACGERWKNTTEDGDLRFAIEDYLAAGAILSYIQHDKSPEAQVCENAFIQSRDKLAELLWDCGSGRELRELGYGADVQFAARLNAYDVAPIMRSNHLEAFSAS